MGRIRIALAIGLLVVGIAGLWVCAVTQDRWLGVSDLLIQDRGYHGAETEHIRALHDGIYFDIEFHHEWDSRYAVRPRLGDLNIHQRGGVTPSKNILPTYWGFSRESPSIEIGMHNESDGISQMSFPVWPVFPFCFVPAAILGVRWWFGRQTMLAGLCVRCKYDLTGNQSGVCPECGLAITPAAMKHIRRSVIAAISR